MALEAWFLAVGNADCSIFFDTDANESVLIDCPGNGAQAAARCLAVAGITRVSVGFITHQHLDHMEGFVELIKLANVAEVRINSGRQISPDVLEDARVKSTLLALSALDESGQTRIRTIQVGTREAVGEWTFTVLVPTAARQLESQIHGPNHASAVIKLEANDYTFIVSADQDDSKCWKKLIADKALDCHVFQLPHHGGRFKGPQSPSVYDVLAATKADYYVISAGNHQRHPDPATITDLTNLGALFFVTGTAASATAAAVALHDGPAPPGLPGVARFGVRP